MMAFWPPADEAAYQARYPFQEYGAGIWGTEERLQAFLAETRQRGCVAWEAPNSRFLVGLPVYSREGSLLAAVGVSVAMTRPWSEAEKDGIVRIVTEAVARLEAGAYVESPTPSASRKAPQSK
jgi:DNA-binding IclR family transcriptional regulator